MTVAGVDEAGRGPLAGPVLCAAVILPPDDGLTGLDDSKKLSEARRERLFDAIRDAAVGYAIVAVAAEEIDRLNIFQATMQGMARAIRALPSCPELALIDGNKIPPGLPCPARALVGGDALERSIMAASVLAKVSRDRIMLAMHAEYPEYGFDRHKGYPTPAHLQALRRHGACPQHRRSFAPVRAAIAELGGKSP
ncbi:MAG: ribonuclease HII [Arenimonas sp.]|nr:ribonuclease HII [Arenimonas sp.]